jgi:hypothetical protein
LYRTSNQELKTWEEPWATLFRLAIAELHRWLDPRELYDAEDHGVGQVKAFDALSHGQQLYLASRVAIALLHEDVEPPELNQCIESTMGTLLGCLEGLLEEELDRAHEDIPTGEYSFEVRQAILNVYASEATLWLDDPEDGVNDLPLVTCLEESEWENLLEAIEGWILWDRDFEDGELYDYDRPDVEEAVLQQMTIDLDYFAWVPREPGKQKSKFLLKRLEELGETPVEQKHLPFPDAPKGMHEMSRIMATGEGDREFTIIVYLGQAGTNLESHYKLRTTTGRTVWWQAPGHYRLVDTGEELKSTEPNAL